MAPVTFNPMKLPGPWSDGYVLDYHSISSVPTGDPYHPYDTKRTELGELVFQLKYRSNKRVLPVLVDTAEEFIRNRWPGSPVFDCITPAPPSVMTRRAQPVVQIAGELAARLGILVCERAVVKVKPTKQMKDIPDWGERQKLLDEAIQKGSGDVKNKRILVLDDLTESGSTLCRVAEVLLKEGGASAVHVLALTRRR